MGDLKPDAVKSRSVLRLVLCKQKARKPLPQLHSASFVSQLILPMSEACNCKSESHGLIDRLKQ